MKYKLLQNLPWLDKWNILYKEDISDIEMKLKQISIWEEPWFKVWKSDWIEVNKLRDWLNYIIEINIGDEKWFELIN